MQGGKETNASCVEGDPPSVASEEAPKTPSGLAPFIARVLPADSSNPGPPQAITESSANAGWNVKGKGVRTFTHPGEGGCHGTNVRGKSVKAATGTPFAPMTSGTAAE